MAQAKTHIEKNTPLGSPQVYEDGSYDVMKHYTMGRVAVELAYVMPDKRTAYVTDDGTNVGFFKYVADKEEDLSCGNLYCSKFTQTSEDNYGTFDIESVYMAYGCEDDIAEYVYDTKFSDIWEFRDGDEDGGCPSGFRPINQLTGGFECLRLKPG